MSDSNLGTFHTDVENSFRMAELLPKGILKVSESGISQALTIKTLRKVGFRGFLIGETFMKTEEPDKALRELINGVLC